MIQRSTWLMMFYYADLITSNFSSVGFAQGIGYLMELTPILDLMKALFYLQVELD